MKVIICIPAFNEEKTIGKTIRDIIVVMTTCNYDYEIHVQDDGSTDKTKEVAELLGAIVYSNNVNLGLAETFRKEMLNAKEADIIVHTDSDNQYNAKHIPELIEKVKEGYDLVLGSRFINDNYSGSFTKKLGNKMFAKAISKIIRKDIVDATTGFRAFNQKVASLEIINTFTYTSEQLIRSAKSGLKIIEIPITTNPTRDSRLFSNPLSYAIKAWTNILRIYRDYEPLKFYWTVGGTLIGLGGILGILILIRILITGDAGGIPRVILSAMFVMTGLQICLSGLGFDQLKK